MHPTLDAFLRSWPFDPWLLAGLIVTGGVYLRGWFILRRRDPRRWHGTHLAAFLGGLAAVFLALASPIEPFAALLLQVHMIQHLLLMMVAPPLLWLGNPLFPLLRGLPGPVRTVWVAPLFRSAWLSAWLERLTHPAVALPVYAAMTWIWHAPQVYDLALRTPAWHYLQHACFLGAALLFWYPVVRPYPARPQWSPWLLVPYLVLADIQNTALAALLTFSDRVLYPHYAALPRIVAGTALEDQAIAGALMWVPGSVAFLLPVFVIGLRLLYGPQAAPAPPPVRGRIPLPLAAPAPAADLLRLPVLGRFLRWRHARAAVQVPLLLLAGLVIWDGLRGPDVSAMNLAGVLPWVHWRGLVVLGLLSIGNVFCFACPFMLPRTLARRWLPAGRAWPRWLRSKLLAVGLLALFLWAYEAFALWDSPWWTAWIVVGYFTAALVIDGFFRGAAFCKYVCPIGQFNFVQSLAAPFTIQARDPAVCATCATRDCIRGRDGIPGCELQLFVPRKAGNMDCTTCLDCVHACPHDNVGLVARAPGAELWRDPPRSGIGRFSRRTDLAALVVLLTFGALANAAGMVGPVLGWQDQFGALLGTSARLIPVTLFYALALVVVPLLAVGGAAALSRAWSGSAESVRLVATRFAYALAPVGFGMWLAHYCFHFLTSWDALVPVVQRAAADLGLLLGAPAWVASCCRPVLAWVLQLEIVFLDLGLLLALYAAYRIALGQTSDMAAALKAFAPWAVLLVGLFAAGVWVLFQPMEMRGTLLP